MYNRFCCYGGIAQLARACGSYPQCRGFKSPSRYAKNLRTLTREFQILFVFCKSAVSTVMRTALLQKSRKDSVFFLSGAGNPPQFFDRVMEHLGQLCIRRFIVHLFAFSPAGDKAAGFQEPEVVGDGRAGHVN